MILLKLIAYLLIPPTIAFVIVVYFGFRPLKEPSFEDQMKRLKERFNERD